ncbi:peroxidase-related enzyme [Leptolyngbya sp. FACHB-541]|uniref:peroxidase-related enzyme n=1 Tax=Leptolyngbya sp. FACHB-541 TaxID=2692810 RepID=UPI001683BCE0|nr:peroxidase-related enzyme [Leptolyngbya sp. FACHB-541]MBD1998014.1 peroxidase-related enzyme [Leptolyngbya sp. FACHB-541]
MSNPSDVSVLEPSTELNDASASWLALPDEAKLPDEIKTLFQQQRDAYGFVHPYFYGYALNPEHFLQWWHYYDAIQHRAGGLSHRERELIAVVVSATNRCESCVLTHQAQLLSVTGDRALTNAVASEYRTAHLTNREHAILDFAVKLTRLDSDLSPDDLELLRDEGLSDEEILEVGEVAGQFSLSNRLSKAFGWKVKPGQLKILN